MPFVVVSEQQWRAHRSQESPDIFRCVRLALVAQASSDLSEVAFEKCAHLTVGGGPVPNREVLYRLPQMALACQQRMPIEENDDLAFGFPEVESWHVIRVDPVERPLDRNIVISPAMPRRNEHFCFQNFKTIEAQSCHEFLPVSALPRRIWRRQGILDNRSAQRCLTSYRHNLDVFVNRKPREICCPSRFGRVAGPVVDAPFDLD
ncbi:hypothetical protein ELH30_16655 [Rhizobium ruizarguesonis]|nr:hypothetical protein ELH30_16655 [Rhizobium ruizarguesonis]